MKCVIKGLVTILKKINGFWNHVLWKATSLELGSVGKNCYACKGFSFNGPENIMIGDNFIAGKNLMIDTWSVYRGKKTGYEAKVNIGNNVTFADNCYISCLNHVEIKDGVLFGSHVFVSDNMHGSNAKEELDISPAERQLSSKGDIHIGTNVWLGRNVCVMPGVHIGDYAIVGANSVVTHDVPPKVIVAGCPARIIRRMEEQGDFEYVQL